MAASKGRGQVVRWGAFRVNPDVGADPSGKTRPCQRRALRLPVLRQTGGPRRMIALYQTLALILNVVFYIMLAHIIMSWLINFQVLNLSQQLVSQIWTGLNRLLEPVYTPIRRILPDTRPLDLAPLVAFIAVIALRDFILPAILLG